MGYDDAPKRRRGLTPMESELRTQAAPPTTPQRGLWSRWLSWRRRRRPPRTLAGALALGLLRLAVAGGLGAVAAIAIAHWLGRDLAVGFYIAGAAVLAVAFMSSAADMESPYYVDRGEREYRIRLSFSYVLVGLVLVGIGVALETF